MTSSDTWKLNRVLGTGGFGTVELWIHVQSGKKIGNIFQYNYKYKEYIFHFEEFFDRNHIYRNL